MDRGRPSKKIFFLILACLIGVSSVGWAVYTTKANSRNSLSNITNTDSLVGTNVLAISEQIAKENSEDGDKDGLVDWEETLWKTDSNNPDTDLDGTKDGEEIKLNRNPKIAGPNDKLNIGSASTEGTKTSEPSKPRTKTDKVSIELFSRYMELKKGGQTLDEKSMTELVNQVFSSINVDETRKISIGDIKTSPQNDMLAAELYAKQMGEILMKFPPGKSEYDIATRYMSTKNQDDLRPLDQIIKNYEAMYSEIRYLVVPSEAASLHVNFLNTISSTKNSIELMRSTTEDNMLVMLMGLNEFITQTENLRAAFNDLVQYFLNKGLILNEGGSEKIFREKI